MHIPLFLNFNTTHHGILELKQEPCLKPYTKLNKDMQTKAKKEGSKIKEQNTKLRSNTIFGISTQNPMNNVNVKNYGNSKTILKVII